MQRHASIVFTLLGIVFLVLSVAAFFGLNDKVTLSAKEMRTIKGQDSDVDFACPLSPRWERPRALPSPPVCA
jgi:hypothetical protein